MKIQKNQAPIQDQNQQLKLKLKQAAELYEKQFLREMVKAMRKSVTHSAMTKPGMAEGIYREQLDEEYVESWVERGGTGFSDMVYQELVDKFFPHLQGKPTQAHKVRPVDVSDRFAGITQSKEEPQLGRHSFRLALAPRKNNESEPSYLNLPWNSKFEKAFQLDSGEQVAQVSHPSGLNSTFVFKGQLKPGLLGQTLAGGESFAQLSFDAESVSWQIQDANSRKDPP